MKKERKHNWQGARDQDTAWEIGGRNDLARANREKATGHGTQKPMECMARPIRNNSARGQIVIDPFLGSGTTLIACERLGRKCRAIEIDPVYVAMSLDRWATETKKKPRLVK